MLPGWMTIGGCMSIQAPQRATPTVMRNGTNQACLFWAKNNMDKVLWRKHEGDGRVLLPWQSMISGFSAACLGPLVTNPFDVAKTRLMAQGGAAADVPKAAKADSVTLFGIKVTIKPYDDGAGPPIAAPPQKKAKPAAAPAPAAAGG